MLKLVSDSMLEYRLYLSNWGPQKIHGRVNEILMLIYDVQNADIEQLSAYVLLYFYILY